MLENDTSRGPKNNQFETQNPPKRLPASFLNHASFQKSSNMLQNTCPLAFKHQLFPKFGNRIETILSKPLDALTQASLEGSRPTLSTPFLESLSKPLDASSRASRERLSKPFDAPSRTPLEPLSSLERLSKTVYAFSRTPLEAPRRPLSSFYPRLSTPFLEPLTSRDSDMLNSDSDMLKWDLKHAEMGFGAC